MAKKELLEIAIEENTPLDPSGVTIPTNQSAKRVIQYGWDTTANIGRRLATDSSGNAQSINAAQLVPKVYDYISLAPSAQPTTITYKSGGAGGTVVATLTLAYDGSGNVMSVTRV